MSMGALLSVSRVDEIKILTVKEVAARLRLKESWVYSHADELGAYRVGKYLRFRWDRVLERLDQGICQTSELAEAV